jgi:hypothetical protein
MRTLSVIVVWQHYRSACPCAFLIVVDRASFVWYRGDNQQDDQEGEGFFGYRSLPLQLADRQRRFSLTLLDEVLPTNGREEVPATVVSRILCKRHPYQDVFPGSFPVRIAFAWAGSRVAALKPLIQQAAQAVFCTPPPRLGL